MKLSLKIFNGLLALLLSGNVIAQTPVADTTTKSQLGGGFELNFIHSYLWRGAYFGADNVSQPVFWLTYNDFSFNVSGNFNLINKTTNYDGYSRKSNWDELDLELDYEHEFKKYTVFGKALCYLYAYQPLVPPTAELNMRVERKLQCCHWSVFTDEVFDVWNHWGGLWSETGILNDRKLGHQWEMNWENALCYGSKVFNEAYYEIPIRGVNLVSSRLELQKNVKYGYYKLYGEYNWFIDQRLEKYLHQHYSYNFQVVFGKEF